MQSDNKVVARVSVRRTFFCLVVPLCCICCCYVGAGTLLGRQYTCPDNSYNISVLWDYPASVISYLSSYVFNLSVMPDRVCIELNKLN